MLPLPALIYLPIRVQYSDALIIARLSLESLGVTKLSSDFTAQSLNRIPPGVETEDSLCILRQIINRALALVVSENDNQMIIKGQF